MNQSEKKTKEQIVNDMVSIAPFHFIPQSLNYIYEAMETYANQRTASLIQAIENKVKDLEELYKTDQDQRFKFRIEVYKEVLTLIKS